ncbi:hypothetical protein J7T55_015351 [Diaporthe amygdali]|uniref:uncharacterized protein n=1 Tax=Phomopsis amygdali TaxID=1214568 RepID=UPI0022FEE5BE|nr:uncharacterized protein J7T55_015351 [Diaporthe amygdali]KAJ0120621.1 hypothetical protein J7T55_015351 [Diaporthe amygdali]
MNNNNNSSIIRQSSQDVKGRVEELLKPVNKHTTFVIADLEEYKALYTAYKSLKNRVAVVASSEDGLPRTAAECAAYVQQLCTAITNFTDIIDKPAKRPTLELNKGVLDDYAITNTAIEAVKALVPLEVQLLGWGIFQAIWAAHFGGNNIPSWVKEFNPQEYDSFRTRFNAVVVALTRSKAIVKGILDSEISFMTRLAIGPEAELKKQLGNHGLHSQNTEQYDIAQQNMPIQKTGQCAQTDLLNFGGSSHKDITVGRTYEENACLSATNRSRNEISFQNKTNMSDNLAYEGTNNMNDKGNIQPLSIAKVKHNNRPFSTNHLGSNPWGTSVDDAKLGSYHHNPSPLDDGNLTFDENQLQLHIAPGQEWSKNQHTTGPFPQPADPTSSDLGPGEILDQLFFEFQQDRARQSEAQQQQYLESGSHAPARNLANILDGYASPGLPSTDPFSEDDINEFFRIYNTHLSRGFVATEQGNAATQGDDTL